MVFIYEEVGMDGAIWHFFGAPVMIRATTSQLQRFAASAGIITHAEMLTRLLP